VPWQAGVSAEDFEAFMQYTACFLGNMGNYLSFGDTKFVPRCPKPTVSNIIGCSSEPGLLAEWEAIASMVYDLSADNKQMGLEGAGISTYYSPNISKEKIQVVQDFLATQNLGDQAYNTRLFDRGDVLELAIASAEVKAPATHEFNGTKIEVTYGDHQPFMKGLADNIEAAIPFVPADRPDQKQMLVEYVKAFRGGNLENHKNSQLAWIKDIVPPPVETNTSAVSYWDPSAPAASSKGSWPC
jgi:dipeptidyl-peptidase-3